MLIVIGDGERIKGVGVINCFADRLTLSEKLDKSFKTTNTGLGKEVDGRFSMAILCEDVEIYDAYVSGIKHINLCHGLKQNYPRVLESLTRQYGEDSEQFVFIKIKCGYYWYDQC